MPSPQQISTTPTDASDEAPFVPSWCYAKGPRMCPCGHHEGYHADEGWCLLITRSAVRARPGEPSNQAHGTTARPAPAQVPNTESPFPNIQWSRRARLGGAL